MLHGTYHFCKCIFLLKDLKVHISSLMAYLRETFWEKLLMFKQGKDYFSFGGKSSSCTVSLVSIRGSRKILCYIYIIASTFVEDI